jgi:hypothetical protein
MALAENIGQRADCQGFMKRDYGLKDPLRSLFLQGYVASFLPYYFEPLLLQKLYEVFSGYLGQLCHAPIPTPFLRPVWTYIRESGVSRNSLYTSLSLL